MAHPEKLETLDWLFAQVCRLHRNRARAIFREIGLHRGQPPVLHHLHQQDGLTHSELGKRLDVSPATTTKMVQRMEQAGFVQRRPDANDQRVSRVYLTDAGRAVKAEMVRRLQTLEAEAFADFSAEEQIIMRRLLMQMRDNLQRVVNAQIPS